MEICVTIQFDEYRWPAVSGSVRFGTMNSLPKPEVILTHESDLDGLVAGVLLQRLARKIFNSDVRLEACNYNYWKQRELRERAAWVTDLAFEPRLDRLNWLIIDHHVSETPPKNAMFIHDLTKSAGGCAMNSAKITSWVHPRLDRLVHLNNVADLFLEEDPDFVLASDYANLVKILPILESARAGWRRSWRSCWIIPCWK
jgi:oligoribonuclease NrnB/cAMP/cGMP phosphodiesterase (DHH superfamily)